MSYEANSPPTGDTLQEEAGCQACAHPLTAHDAIALRFCGATTVSGNARGCMCSGHSAGMTYANSTREPISGDHEPSRG
ncbi:RGCVC family protein [Actinokineospora pegani]|uniref:RGCVC family protein n=1 Tax=Actinokineospora pegani TaxID=2654637 RepID=UPI0012EA8C90|nr:RGCVC family protein [Actinokineospora pegani]